MGKKILPQYLEYQTRKQNVRLLRRSPVQILILGLTTYSHPKNFLIILLKKTPTHCNQKKNHRKILSRNKKQILIVYSRPKKFLLMVQTKTPTHCNQKKKKYRMILSRNKKQILIPCFRPKKFSILTLTKIS